MTSKEQLRDRRAIISPKITKTFRPYMISERRTRRHLGKHIHPDRDVMSKTKGNKDLTPLGTIRGRFRVETLPDM